MSKVLYNSSTEMLVVPLMVPLMSVHDSNLDFDEHLQEGKNQESVICSLL